MDLAETNVRIFGYLRRLLPSSDKRHQGLHLCCGQFAGKSLHSCISSAVGNDIENSLVITILNEFVIYQGRFIVPTFTGKTVAGGALLDIQEFNRFERPIFF